MPVAVNVGGARATRLDPEDVRRGAAYVDEFLAEVSMRQQATQVAQTKSK